MPAGGSVALPLKLDEHAPVPGSATARATSRCCAARSRCGSAGGATSSARSLGASPSAGRRARHRLGRHAQGHAARLALRLPDRVPGSSGCPRATPDASRCSRSACRAARATPGVRVLSGAVVPQILLAPNENRLAGETALDLVENPYLDRYGDRVPVSGLLLPRRAATTSASRRSPARSPAPTGCASGRTTRRRPGQDPIPRPVRVDRPSCTSGPRLARAGSIPTRCPSRSTAATGPRRTSPAANVTVELGQLAPGIHRVRISAADYQELKNSENADERPLPNTRVGRPASACAERRACNGVAGRASIVRPDPFSDQESHRVDLYEHQGKELLARYGIPVSEGRVALTPAEARAAAAEGSAARSSSRRRC